MRAAARRFPCTGMCSGWPGPGTSVGARRKGVHIRGGDSPRREKGEPAGHPTFRFEAFRSSLFCARSARRGQASSPAFELDICYTDPLGRAPSRGIREGQAMAILPTPAPGWAGFTGSVPHIRSVSPTQPRRVQTSWLKATSRFAGAECHVICPTPGGGATSAGAYRGSRLRRTPSVATLLRTGLQLSAGYELRRE